MICVKKNGAAAALALLISFGPAQAQDVTGETVLATVGGVDITLGHMVAARETLPDQYLQLPDDVLFEGLLDQLIQQNALAQALPVDLNAATRKGLDNQISGYLAGVALDDILAGAVTDEAVQAAYDARFAEIAPETEYNAAHILVVTQEEAAALKEQVDGGADFAVLAREHSTGPSGPNGGALGWFSEGMMVAPFEAAVMELAVGDVSGPVQTQFGWHLVRLNETRQKDAPPLAEVRGELVEELQEAAVQAEVARVTEAADVTRMDVVIDPSLMRDPAFLGD